SRWPCLPSNSIRPSANNVLNGPEIFLVVMPIMLAIRALFRPGLLRRAARICPRIVMVMSHHPVRLVAVVLRQQQLDRRRAMLGSRCCNCPAYRRHWLTLGDALLPHVQQIARLACQFTMR